LVCEFDPTHSRSKRIANDGNDFVNDSNANVPSPSKDAGVDEDVLGCDLHFLSTLRNDPYEISKLKARDLLLEERPKALYYVIDYKSEKWLTMVAAESYDIKRGVRSSFFMTDQDLLTWRAHRVA
jgi:hypothetical protein